jgi:hypothetical protein
MDDLVAKALHAARQHFDEGGFLDTLRGMFSGPDVQSTGEAASPTNWGDPESAADFFRADKALRLARQASREEPPLTAPRPGAVEVRDLPEPQRRPVIPEAVVQSAPPLSAPVPDRSEPIQPSSAIAYAPEDGKLTQRAAPEAPKLASRAAPEITGADDVWTRMLRQESGNRQFDRYGRTITSPAGALGISQVMPTTGPEAARLAGLPWSLERLRNDQEYNHALGRAYYDAQLARFGDPALAAAAYNGGPGRVAQALRLAQQTGRPWTAFLKPETQNYVRVVSRAEGGEVGAPDGIGQALDVVRREPMTPAALARAWTPPEESIAANVGPRAAQIMQEYPEKLYSAIGAMPGEMLETAKLPGQVLSGERSFDPHSDEDIHKALNLAAMAQTGGIGGASARAGETVLGSGPTWKFEPIRKLIESGMTPTEIEMALQMARERIPANHPTVMWHGTPSGDLRGGVSGLHLGTHEAARQALNARIGMPAEGNWTGLRVYGETPIAGERTILSKDQYGMTGYNVRPPMEDYLPKEQLKYANGQIMPMDVEPVIYPFRITGEMSNKYYLPMSDMRANATMQGQLKKGQAKRGYYYGNEGEDVGSISAVVPGPHHVQPIDLERLLRTGEYANGGSVENRALMLVSRQA